MTDFKNSTPIATVDVIVPPNDVESQTQEQFISEATHAVTDDSFVGKGMGIAIFVLIIVGFVSSFFLPFLSLPCMLTAIVLESVLTCGCCCAKDYNLAPHVKKWATGTLVTLCLMITIQIITAVLLLTALSEEFASTGTVTESSIYSAAASLLPLSIAYYVLVALALVFSAMFTWGRRYGAPRG